MLRIGVLNFKNGGQRPPMPLRFAGAAKKRLCRQGFLHGGDELLQREGFGQEGELAVLG
jgi:hypothetical protein